MRPLPSDQRASLDEFGCHERLAVYGSLRPGECNAHLLQHLRGVWLTGVVSGVLEDKGWGAARGHPGIRLTSGNKVEVHLFCSHLLPAFWSELDQFEGDGYRRVTTVVLVGDEAVCANIYELA